MNQILETKNIDILTIDMFKKEPIESDYEFINFYNVNYDIFKNINDYNKKIERYYHCDPFNKKMDLVFKMISSLSFDDKRYKYDDVEKCLTITQEVIDFVSTNDNIYVTNTPVCKFNGKTYQVGEHKSISIDIEEFKKIFTTKENQKYIFYVFTINENESTIDVRYAKI